jgi:thymidylate synthase
MKQYQDLIRQILEHGSDWQENRTGIRTKMIPGAMMQFNMEDGFPAMTTKKLAFNAVKGELLGFLRGYTSAKQFRSLNCRIWDANANENKAWLANPNRKGPDDLGYIYSRLWVDMPTATPVSTDFGTPAPQTWNQIEKLLEAIKKDPTSRRLIVSSWHPEVFDQAALPPCHVLFQVIIEQSTKKMHMTMYQRSCDLFLGVPFNIASYALLLHILAAITGYKPGMFTWFGADVHIYENHLEQCKLQLSREPLPLPTLWHAVTPGTKIEEIEPDWLKLHNYNFHETIQAEMAV